MQIPGIRKFTNVYWAANTQGSTQELPIKFATLLTCVEDEETLRYGAGSSLTDHPELKLSAKRPCYCTYQVGGRLVIIEQSVLSIGYMVIACKVLSNEVNTLLYRVGRNESSM